jgi:hypothetical protein
VEDDGDDSLPYFPSSPPGRNAMEHEPTVEARIRYWQAVHILATGANMPAMARTASGLQASYEQARQELNMRKAAEPQVGMPYARRGRLPPSAR